MGFLENFFGEHKINDPGRLLTVMEQGCKTQKESITE